MHHKKLCCRCLCRNMTKMCACFTKDIIPPPRRTKSHSETFVTVSPPLPRFPPPQPSPEQSRSSERRHVSGALRSASKLPRYSSDRLQSPVHGGTGTMVAGGRRSGGRRTMQRGDTGPRVERVQEGAAGGSERLGGGFVGGSSPPGEWMFVRQ